MSDQNLEYTLDVLVDDADKRMKALFASWDKLGKEASKAYGKGLADSAREAKTTADNVARMFSDLDKAVTRAERSTEGLVRKYAGISPEVDKAIAKLKSLVDHNKSLPEVTKIRDTRESTPAGQMNVHVQGIIEQIKASVATAQLRSKEQAELDKHQQWVEKKNAQMNKGLAQLAESRTNKEEAEQYKRIKINTQVMEFEEQQRLKEQEQLSKHQQWVETQNAKMHKGLLDLSESRTKKEQDEQYKRIKINTQVAEYQEQARQKEAVSQVKHQQWVEGLNAKMNKGLLKLAEDKVNTQRAIDKKELQDRDNKWAAIQAAVAREDALEKQREQEAISRYKIAQEAGEKRRQAEESAEQLGARSVKQQNALWAAVEKADSALDKQAQSFRELGNTGAAEEVEKLRSKLQQVASIDMGKIGSKGTLLPTANVDKFLADNRLLIQGYDDQIKKESEVAKVSAASHEERIRQAEKLNTTEAQIRVTRYSDNVQFQNAVKAQEAETAAFLTNLKTRSVGMTKSQVESEIVEHQRLAAAKISLAAEGAQAQVNAEFARVTAMNKATMAVFAVQQAVEDYSYAGLRGAMNNLSMLAMMIGGTGGLVALFGAMAVNVGITSGAFDKFAESLGLSSERTKKQSEELQKMYENIRKLKDIEHNSKKEMSDFNPAESGPGMLALKKASLEEDIRLEKEKAKVVTEAVQAYEEMLRISKEIGSKAVTGTTDINYGAESPETILKNIDRIRNANLGLTHSSNPEAVKLFNDQLDRMAKLEVTMSHAGFSPDLSGFQKAKDEARGLNNGVMELLSTLRLTTKQQEILAASGITSDSMKELVNKKFSASSNAPGGDVGKGLNDYVGKQNLEYHKSVVELTNKYAIALQEAGGDGQKIIDLTIQHKAELEKVGGQVEANIKGVEATAVAVEKTVKGYEEAERSIKTQITDTERLLEVSEKQLQNLLEQKSAWQDTEAKRKAAALDKIDDLKFEEKKDEIDKKLKEGPGGLEWAKQRKEYLKDLAKYQLDTMKQANGNGKGDLNPDKRLQQEYDAYINNLDREYDAYVKNLERKAQADKDHAEKSTNAEKQKRLDQLKEDLGGKAQDSMARANQLLADGKWEQAKSEYDKALKSLKELHDAQQKFVGKTTSTQSIQAEKDMESTSNKINKLYDEMAALETKRQEKYKVDLDEQKILLNDIINEKAAAAAINLFNPAELGTLAAIDAALARILAKMQQISQTQMVGSSRVTGQPIGPNQPPVTNPPTVPPPAAPPAPPAAPPTTPAGGGGFPSIPPAGRDLPPMFPDEDQMEQQEKATAEHWAKQKQMRDKAALDERVAAAENRRISLAEFRRDANSAMASVKDTGNSKFPLIDKIGEAAANATNKLHDFVLENESADAAFGRLHNKRIELMEKERGTKNGGKANFVGPGVEPMDAVDAAKMRADAVDELVKLERSVADKTRKERDQAQADEVQKAEAAKKAQRDKLDDARRKAGLPLEDWKKKDYEEAVKAEQRVQNIQKQTAAEQAGIGAVTSAKAKAEAIKMIDPNEISTIQGVNSQLERTLALVQAIGAASSMSSGMGAGAGGRAGGGGGGPVMNVTNNFSGTSPLSAMMAASAAAQNFLITRR